MLSRNQSILLSSAGYGVLISLALSGGLRIVSGLAGMPVEADTANLAFLASCLVLVPITTYFRVAATFFPPEASREQASRE
jgi:hypothetical protein